MAMQWYVIHAYSGYEERVKAVRVGQAALLSFFVEQFHNNTIGPLQTVG